MFIGADIGMQQLEETGEVDVLRIVSVMRQDRGGMVQTKEQYLFLHQVRGCMRAFLGGVVLVYVNTYVRVLA